MSNITQKTDYSTGLKLFLTQYKNSTKLKGVVDSAYDRADDIELALFEIRDEYWLSTAIGDQLDVLGSIFQVSRDGDIDADYRARIQAKASLIASGEPESIISILKDIFGGTFAIYYQSTYPSPPAMYYVYSDGTITIAELIAYSPSGVLPHILFPLEFEDGDKIEFQDGEYLFAVD